MLHTDQDNTGPSSKWSEAPVSHETTRNAEITGLSVNYSTLNEPQVLLSTVRLLIKDLTGKWHQCRALLDNGSQSNFITANLTERLQLSRVGASIPIVGVGASHTQIVSKTFSDIKSFNDNYVNNKVEFLILDKITERLPSIGFDTSELKLPPGIQLSDTSFNVPSEIDILLGAGLFYQILRHGTRSLGPNKPVLQNTVFGWVLSGNLVLNNANHKKVPSNIEVQNQLEKFWQIEEIPDTKPMTLEETECERIFIETTTRNEQGHFVVELPLRDNFHELGSTLDAAKKRLQSVERKFERNIDFKNKYCDFMTEYEQLGHMTKILPNFESNIVYYLPHHGVLNTSSITTKLRTVFDGSCKSDTGFSLNDVLMTGPTIQSDLFSILLRFRKHNIVLVADIEKMYRMVYIAEKHRDYQRIMWRGNPSSEISHFRLNTVTYGLSASLYLAIRSLNQAAIEQREAYPEASDAIINDMYVDDLISGSSDIESASQLRADITKVLSPYGFKLRKWCANVPSVLEGSSSTNSINSDSYYLCKDEIRHALGLTWYPNQDMLSYAFKIEFPNKRITKRVVLSVVASIFDPLGLMSPVIISFKILLQQLWQQNLQWDEPLPQKLLDVWNHLISDIDSINSIQVSRHILVNHPAHVELHCFSDASQSAYGCCIYIKSIDATGQAVISLVCSKSRVAPLKTLSIPRLELCGAVLSTRLSKKVSQALKININACYYWVDSTIVLSWISTCPSKLKVFVSNRIAEIQRCTNVQQWAHVSSSDNPADLVSRGLNATELKQCTLWWNGPSWLVHKQADWPKISEVEVKIPELKPKKLTLLAREQSEFKLIERFSSLHRARRVTAWCFRFYHNLNLPAAKRNLESLSVTELNNSTIALLKLAQRTMFPDEISCIVNNKPISKKSKLVPFDPIVDKQGLLRIGVV
nr:unnamed protein product [Callosobruchus chinensis]